MPNGQSLCATCEDISSRAVLFVEVSPNATLDAFAVHMQQVNGEPLGDDVKAYLAVNALRKLRDV